MINEVLQVEGTRFNLVSDSIQNLGLSEKVVLVTGGAGYIGSILVEQLLEQGYKVKVLDRFLFGRDSLSFCFDTPEVEFIYSDLQNEREIDRYLSDVDAVVHLAGLVGDPSCAVDQEFTRQSNILTTRNLYRAVLKAEIPRFVFASSCSVYGFSEAIAYEDGPTNPVSIYAETKLESEHDILSALSDRCCATILRFATVFGHSYRPRFDLVGNRFVAQAIDTGKISVHGGSQFRPFVHTRDIVRAIVKVLEAPTDKVHGQIFNVGDQNVTFSIQGLAEVVQSVLSNKYPIQLNIESGITDPRSYVVCFDKIKNVLGFSASVSLEQGVTEIAQNFEWGTYLPYTHASYSNVEVTKRFVVYHSLFQRELSAVA